MAMGKKPCAAHVVPDVLLPTSFATLAHMVDTLLRGTMAADELVTVNANLVGVSPRRDRRACPSASAWAAARVYQGLKFLMTSSGDASERLDHALHQLLRHLRR